MSASTVKVGIIGYGYWGPNLVRNFSSVQGCKVTAICDGNATRLAAATATYPAAKGYSSAKELVSDPNVDLVLVATPVSTHYELARMAIDAGKHVLVEKPMTANLDDAQRLVDAAAKKEVMLAADHTFVFTGAVQKMRDAVASGSLGDLYYYDSVRVNLGLFQHDVNVIWDLAIHDFSIMEYVLPMQPEAVSAIAVKHFPGQVENMAYVTLFYPGNFVGHVHVNWIAPVKVRKTLLGGSKSMIVYDELESDEKIKIYDKGVTMNPDAEKAHQLRVGYRSGDILVPQLPVSEALKVEAQHLIDCVANGKKPRVDGEAACRVVKILEKAEESARKQGAIIRL